ncbi:hypothetical protein ACJX0J_036310, partial [Zea mays]
SVEEKPKHLIGVYGTVIWTTGSETMFYMFTTCSRETFSAKSSGGTGHFLSHVDTCAAMKEKNDLVEFNMFLNIILMVHSCIGSTLMLGHIRIEDDVEKESFKLTSDIVLVSEHLCITYHTGQIQISRYTYLDNLVSINFFVHFVPTFISLELVLG